MSMKVKGVLLAGVAAAALSAGSAWAAPPPSAWTGLYFGANAGGGWSNGNTTFANNLYNDWPTPHLDGLDGSGALGGVQAGFDTEFGNTVVLGGVVDVGATAITGDRWFGGKSGYGGSLPFFGGKGDQKVSSHYNYLATARLRAGLAMGNFLFFATGGLAMAGMEHTYTNATYPSDSTSRSNTGYGWVAGLGGEVKLSPTTSLQMQYLHADFGTQVLPFTYNGRTGQATFNDSLNVITAGLNFKLP